MMSRFFLFGVFAVCLVLLPPALAGDWPTYAKDMHRGNVTDETLTFPLRLAWSYHCAQPPRPAWSEPEKVLNRLDFDYAFHPVSAGGIVLFASSADDTVRAGQREITRSLPTMRSSEGAALNFQATFPVAASRQ